MFINYALNDFLEAFCFVEMHLLFFFFFVVLNFLLCQGHKFCCCLKNDVEIWFEDENRISIYFVLQMSLISTINIELTQVCPLKSLWLVSKVIVSFLFAYPYENLILTSHYFFYLFPVILLWLPPGRRSIVYRSNWICLTLCHNMNKKS